MWIGTGFGGRSSLRLDALHCSRQFSITRLFSAAISRISSRAGLRTSSFSSGVFF